MKIIRTFSIAIALSIAVAMLGGAAQAQMKLPELKKQSTPQAVLDEHFAALNACDWDRRGSAEVDRVGEDGELAGVDRALLRPGARPAERRDAGVRRRPGPVCCRGQHRPRRVPARHRTRRHTLAQERHLPEVE